MLCKFEKQAKFYSFDGGKTWLESKEYRAGELITPDSTDCYYESYVAFLCEDDAKFRFTSSISYSLDSGATWTNLAANTQTPTVAKGSKIYWKKTATAGQSQSIGTFSSIGKFRVEGNAMSLLFGDNYMHVHGLGEFENCFESLFASCSGLTDAHGLLLTATTLGNECYKYMFDNCENMKYGVRVLPAEELKASCYECMFVGCTSLLEAPRIEALYVSPYCFENMFEDCSSLEIAPTIKTLGTDEYSHAYMFQGCTKLKHIECHITSLDGNNCTTDWVNGVASSGTFVKKSSMTAWTRGNDGIPYSWTITNVI